jgi:hypothetical protein
VLEQISTNVTEHVFGYAVGAIAIWLFVVMPLRAAAGRRRVRRTLRSLLNADLIESRMFVRRDLGIGVDESSLKFAVVTNKMRLILAGSELVSIEFKSPGTSALVATLNVETRNQDLPRLEVNTGFKNERLGEIAARLRLLFDQNKKAIDEERKLAPDESLPHEVLNLTMRDLTAAVNRLADVLTKMGRRDSN